MIEKNKDDIYKLFMERVCKHEEIYINRQPLLINVNYKITDPNVKETKKIIPEKEGFYTESPILEINDIERFKTALYDFALAYTNNKSLWTMPDLADTWEDRAIYCMGIIWTNATNQDFTNPIDFLNRYTAFLTQNQLEDLKEEQEAREINGVKTWKHVKDCYSERETPHNYYLFMKDEGGNKLYFPSVCFGIQDNKAYVYAIHQIYGKNQKENEDMQGLRRYIKGRGVEPLGIATLISFIEEIQKRGIKEIVMPDNFVMQYTAKNKLKEDFIDFVYRGKPEDIEKAREKKETELDSNHRGSLNNRLMTMFLISKYYSTGLVFTEIPGEVSDNLTVDIRNFKIGREEKKNEDRRNKKRIEEER